MNNDIRIKLSRSCKYILLMPSIPHYLTEYLLTCNKLELLSETIRKAIAQNPYFQPVSVFQRFDKFRKGYLEPADFSEFMLENQVYPTESELYLIFKDFDRKKVGIVTLDEFEAELLSKENRSLRKEVLARHPYPVELRLSLDLQFLLGKYFQHKIKIAKDLNEIRDKLKLLKSYASDDAFFELDNKKNGYISDISELDTFLRRNGRAISHEQLNRIFRVLSFQENREITLKMFREHIDPFCMGCYPGYKQKIHEKEVLEHRFLEKKFEIEHSRMDNIVKRESIAHDIEDLRDSNRRLQHLMEEQELSYRRDLSRRYY